MQQTERTAINMPQARICENCEKRLQIDAADGRNAEHIYWCNHHGPVTSRIGFLAIASARRGVITRWQIVGPLDEVDGQAMARDYTARCAEDGTPELPMYTSKN